MHALIFLQCTDALSSQQSQENVFPELTILSVANLLGETIWRVYNATSVQALRD